MRNCPPLIIQNTTIHPTEHHHFLSLLVDQELSWKFHTGHAIAKGNEYVLQLRRLSRLVNGILVKQMCQLYLTVAVPKFTYRVNLWFRLVYSNNLSMEQRGSKGIAKRLATVQQITALSITGAMRMTATDVLNNHTNLLPVLLLLQKICH
ncbi:hypothetical protein CY34DRAFT_98971 [Suillus luteus UH-Slu-Lm8-n1]|uniref:Uncharacterized protein n=1 Tax=Suillus luteus UH-Slu-Lm8-n1 TaxID=930992 RepID=A0A0D0AHN4_9AGAM|nr:hypothetical protein CY34DRAFT_98971 [Suillus luteus UH-Slu-Lm8-n1]